MINQEFCDFLEYQITKALKHLDNEDIKGFWCDGVLLDNCSKKIIKEETEPNWFSIDTKMNKVEVQLD